jgi:hypothetical protein
MIGAAVLLQLAFISPGWAASAATRLVSASSSGAQGNGGSYWASTSSDGRFVVFESQASDLVADDTNAAGDVFIRDRATGTVRRVSISSAGIQGNAQSYSASISASGRFVAFASAATNLVSNDTNGVDDVFVRDRLDGVTRRISLRSSGAEVDGSSFSPSISADGRFVAFTSTATDLVAGDTNNAYDIFVRDRVERTTRRISVSSGGAEGDGDSSNPRISANGRFVAFTSGATTLVGNDTNGDTDVFVRDRLDRTTRRISVSSAGVQGNDASNAAAISANGGSIAFTSHATNLVSGDTNGFPDLFVRDRSVGTTRRISVSPTGGQANGYTFNSWISADGRFVVFSSQASNLIGVDTNGVEDVFIRDRERRVTRRISVSSAGGQANGESYDPSISADGRFVTFDSSATNLIANDANGYDDIFIRGPLG